MKKLLITLSAIAVAMLAFTATSEAGHQVRYLAGYDSCGRPVYAYRYVPTSYGRSYCQPSYRSYGRSYSYRPSYRSYGHSSRSYGHSYGHSSRGHSYGRSYCR